MYAPSTSSLGGVSSSKYTQEQLMALEACYEKNNQPSSQDVKELSVETGLTQAQCRAWLQYQRKKRKKHLMEHEREVFRIEIKCLNQRIGSVKEQNDKLHRENQDLRRSFEQLKEYEQELDHATSTLESGKREVLEEAAMTLAGALTKKVEDIAERNFSELSSLKIMTPRSAAAAAAAGGAGGGEAGSSRSLLSDGTPESNVSAQQHFSRKQSFTGTSGKRTEEEIVEDLCKNVGEQLRNASNIVTKAMDQSQDLSHARTQQVTLHHPDTINIRHVLSQKESALSDEILKSVEAILKSQTSDDSKSSSIAPLLQSYLRTETSIKEQQMLLKTRMLAHLPLIPHQGDPKLADPCEVKCTSMFCIFSHFYLGLAERSLCLMGEASLYALLTQSQDFLLKSRKCLSPNDQRQLGMLLVRIKQGEMELIRQFEEKWALSYTLTREHHNPAAAAKLFQSAFRQCLLDQPETAPGQTAMHNLMSGIMSTSAQLYINGLKAVHRTLSPVLCAKVFSAMKEIRQLLITADSFNEQVHQVKKLWQ